MDLNRKRASPTESAVMWDLADGNTPELMSRSGQEGAGRKSLKQNGDRGRLIRIHALNV